MRYLKAKTLEYLIRQKTDYMRSKLYYLSCFKTSLHYKDLRISRNIIKKNSLNLPGSKLVYKYMKETSKDKHRNKDSSAYYLTLKKNNK